MWTDFKNPFNSRFIYSLVQWYSVNIRNFVISRRYTTL